MVKKITLLFFCIIASGISQIVKADMTIQELIFEKDKPLHLKILDVLPEEAKISYGSEIANNTIIEFMDYFCGYCKKMHPELINLANERNDLKVIFLQHPIISPGSTIISKLVIAANFQNKGYELHHSIFSISGSITQEKIDDAIIKSGINTTRLKIDLGRPEIEEIIELTSFLAGGFGARGTPTLFVNNEFIGGYISPQQIVSLLN